MVVSHIFYVHPECLGETIQFDEHIFQMGWFNHQLVYILGKPSATDGTRTKLHLNIGDSPGFFWLDSGPNPQPWKRPCETFTGYVVPLVGLEGGNVQEESTRNHLKFNSSPLKSYRDPKGKDHLPTVIFQVLRLMVQKSCAS